MRATTSLSIFSLFLILFSGTPGLLGTAAAQQQEKRIALVVGNGAYAKSPLATAANDAGLIAQTLQAAGFDVVAPGTVAPAEQGSYGVYAQSLAEMIRTGGLPLPELFDRVRLRVNDASKGAQLPWHANKIDAQFMFFDRAPDAPAPAPPDQVAAIRSRPIRDLGLQDAYAAAVERDSMQGYEDFLAAYPGDPLARRVRAIAAARREAITWLRTYRTDTPQAYWSYLRRYPRGPHAADARRRLAILTAPLEPPPAFAVSDYDVPPPHPDEIVYVERPVLYFSDP